jgi:type II secretory pathway component HofQ
MGIIPKKVILSTGQNLPADNFLNDGDIIVIGGIYHEVELFKQSILL